MSNRLIHEKSPYLLQHADNPVDWYPWGEEAFARARSEDLPVFLSIGYSTCHWCHVMEKESFENEEIASILNEHFVSIKVDREERPDVDRLYMSALQAMGQGGGWPMSMFLTPGLEPFWGGTYFPPVSRYGRAGFGEILQRIAHLWKTDRAKSAEAARAMMTYLNDLSHRAASEEQASASSLDLCFQQLEQSYDPVFGGFGGGPKFPRPVSLLFLLRYHARTGSDRAREMVEQTLSAMAAGGIHDHVGGGFHRYAVDREWRVPHFEKMLYDQAQLLCSYVAAHQLTGRPEFAATAHGIAEYVLRDLTREGGGFFSAEDADSVQAGEGGEMGEGAYYLWTAREIREALGEDAVEFAHGFGIEEDGNALHDPQQEFTGRNILYRPTERDSPGALGSPEEAAREERWRRTLLRIRSGRPRPRLDDKVITSWNGLMISALARAAGALGDVRMLEAAERSAHFVLTALVDRLSQTLLRRYRDGESRFEASCEDYAFFIEACIDLYEVTGRFSWLKEAIRLTERQVELFHDTSGGGFFDTSGNDPSILVRSREQYDGAEPTANSVSAMNLLRLSAMTGREEWRRMAEGTFESFANILTKHPVAVPQMVSALDFALSSPVQIVLSGPREGCLALAQRAFSRYVPNRIVLYRDGGEGEAYLKGRIPVLSAMDAIDGKPTAYLCKDFVCTMPTTDPETLTRLLAEA